MIAYRKFRDTRQNEVCGPTPPKPAKTPKVEPAEQEARAVTLGGLGALDGLRAETAIPPSLHHALAPWAEAEEERAAHIEHDGRIAREWAEGFARLDPEQPPGDVPPTRWQRFVDDVGRFLDSPFCAVAAALGWKPHDLFGCNRDRPFARLDQAGLMWVLDGRRLAAMSEDAAVIEARGGVRTTYRLNACERTSGPAGQVLAWELAK